MPSARASDTASSCSASARPARVAGSDGTPTRRSGATTSDPGADHHDRPGAPVEPVGERVVGERPVRVDAGGDDLGHGVDLDEVDPLERGDDGVLGRPEGLRRGLEADVRRGAAAASRSATRRTSASARWLPVGAGSIRACAAGRPRARPGAIRGPRARRRAGGRPARARSGPRPAARPPRRRPARSTSSSAPSSSVSVIVDPDPRARRVAEQPGQLLPGDAVAVDPVERLARQPPRLGLGHRAPVRLAQELRLEREVDRARGDVERELLRVEVVLEQAHRERQRDPGAEALARPAHPAVDDGAGERPAVAVETGDAEEPQDRPLLAERRRGPGRRAERRRERGSARSTSSSSGPEVRASSRRASRPPRGSSSVRSTGRRVDDVPVAALDRLGAEQRIDDGRLGRLDDRVEERVEVLVVDRPRSSGAAARPPRGIRTPVENARKMSPDPCPALEPVRARPSPARRARRSSAAGRSGASVATTTTQSAALALGVDSLGQPSAIERLADPDAVDGQARQPAEVGERQHADRVGRGVGRPAALVGPQVVGERRSIGIDHPRGGADAALELEAAHPGPGADGAARDGRRARRPARSASAARTSASSTWTRRDALS